MRLNELRKLIPSLVGALAGGFGAILAFVLLLILGSEVPAFLMILFVFVVAIAVGLTAGLAARRWSLRNDRREPPSEM